MFFVATAPVAGEGLVNLSPKGLGTFAIVDPHSVAYLDLTGSGVETIAHLRENGRITIMFCAFDGVRSVIHVGLTRIADSCDYAVPRYRYEDQRTQLGDWARRKGAEAVRRYQDEHNRVSLDGLPGLRGDGA